MKNSSDTTEKSRKLHLESGRTNEKPTQWDGNESVGN